MQIKDFMLHVEAILFASQDPIDIPQITEALNKRFEFISERIEHVQVENAVQVIFEKYQSNIYSFQIHQTGGGWQFLSKKEFHKTISVLNKEKFLKRLSKSTLETLAIIAYQQPTTKAEIEAIRGVNCDYAVQKLIEKDLATISGRNEELAGKPLLYITSNSFMNYFGLNSMNDLPNISEVNRDYTQLEKIIEERKKEAVSS